MKKIAVFLMVFFVFVGCQKHTQALKVNSEKTPGQVVSESMENEWVDIDQEHALYLQLDTGWVVMVMQPDMAPVHVSNTKALVRQGVFDGTQFYRVLDGFVAQGGPLNMDVTNLVEGELNVKAEFTSTNDISADFALLSVNDGYADETGFYKGFAAGRDNESGESWLLHCYGALAMGRGNDINTGGLALYVVNGPAQRYLDRNTTVFGRVLWGMEHIQSLKRTADLNGPIDIGDANPIVQMKVGSDLPVSEQKALQIMDTSSASFDDLMAARKNRSGEWFVHQHDYMDACGMPIPVRMKPQPQ